MLIMGLLDSLYSTAFTPHLTANSGRSSIPGYFNEAKYYRFGKLNLQENSNTRTSLEALISLYPLGIQRSINCNKQNISMNPTF